MEKPNNTIRIPTSLKGNFFKIWLESLKMLHGLTSREMDILAAFLKKRYEFSQKISDPDILDKFLMSEEIKAQIRDECNITVPHFQVVMTKLKKERIVVDNKINPKLIPMVKPGSKNFQLLFYFELEDD